MSESVATFTDRFGDERVIHKTRHGLKVKRTHATPILQMNPVVGAMVGERVRELRLERGMSLKDLAERCGMNSGHPKARMYEIEKGARQEGLRFGTLYALAMALDVDVSELLPSVREVAAAANVREIPVPQVRIA